MLLMLAALQCVCAQPVCSGSGFAKPVCDALMRARAEGMRSDALFVDIGAAGGGERRVARRFGHPYLGFECRTDEVRHLRERFRDNVNETLVQACVSNHSGFVKIFHALDSSSLHPHTIEALHSSQHKASLAAKTDGEKAPRQPGTRRPLYTVETSLAVTLDSVLLSAEGHQFPPVGFLKVDVQGHEPAVLSGALGVLRAHRPWVFYETSLLPAALGNGTLLRSLTLGYTCDCRGGTDCYCAPPQAELRL